MEIYSGTYGRLQKDRSRIAIFLFAGQPEGIAYAYRAYGAYATLRGIAIGNDYKYNMGLAGIDTPGKGTLEGMVSYNYTCLSDASAAIFGGRVSDVSCGVNYYFNRYITGKLRYSYTHTWDRAGVDPMSLNAVQLRLQVIF